MGATLFGKYNESQLFTSSSSRHGRQDPAEEVTANVPVFIIGDSPTGLSQAYLLSRLGVRSLVVERHPEGTDAPKAHALSLRSLEMSPIRAGYGSHSQPEYPKRRCTLGKLPGYSSGIPLGRLPYERMDVEVLDATPEMVQNIPQPDREQYISEELSKQSLVEIRKGISFVSLEQ